MGFISSIKKTATNIYKKYQSSKPKNLVSNVVPFGPPASKVASAVSKAPSLIKKAYTSVKTFATKKTINPLAGVTSVKAVPKALGKVAGVGALAGSLFGAGRVITKAGVSGDLPSVSEAGSSIGKSAVVGTGIAVSPVGGIIGAIEGTGRAVTDTAKNFYNILAGRGQSIAQDVTNKFNDISNNLPTNPVNFSQGDTIINLPGTEGLTSFPQQPVNIFVPEQTPLLQAPSYNPSFSLGGFGGGLSENLPLLLLLSGLGGGYLLGKKKKKKKKRRKKKKK